MEYIRVAFLITWGVWLAVLSIGTICFLIILIFGWIADIT